MANENNKKSVSRPATISRIEVRVGCDCATCAAFTWRSRFTKGSPNGQQQARSDGTGWVRTVNGAPGHPRSPPRDASRCPTQPHAAPRSLEHNASKAPGDARRAPRPDPFHLCAAAAAATPPCCAYTRYDTGSGPLRGLCPEARPKGGPAARRLPSDCQRATPNDYRGLPRRGGATTVVDPPPFRWSTAPRRGACPREVKLYAGTGGAGGAAVGLAGAGCLVVTIGRWQCQDNGGKALCCFRTPLPPQHPGRPCRGMRSGRLPGTPAAPGREKGGGGRRGQRPPSHVTGRQTRGRGEAPCPATPPAPPAQDRAPSAAINSASS